jgi:hypothetical protein
VALQPKQFSAWNTGAGGNNLVRKYGPDSAPYQRAGGVLDAVMAGRTPDPTGGATHYYSPAGMDQLVNQGAQQNSVPNWLAQEAARRGGNNTTIGGHVFTGLAQGTPQQPPQQAETTIGTAGAQDGTIFDKLLGAAEGGAFDDFLGQQQQEEQPVQLQAPQATPIQASNRDPLAAYRELFKTLG